MNIYIVMHILRRCWRLNTGESATRLDGNAPDSRAGVRLQPVDQTSPAELYLIQRFRILTENCADCEKQHPEEDERTIGIYANEDPESYDIVMGVTKYIRPADTYGNVYLINEKIFHFSPDAPAYVQPRVQQAQTGSDERKLIDDGADSIELITREQLVAIEQALLWPMIPVDY